MLVDAVCGALTGVAHFLGEVATHLHPVFYVYIPYWAVISTLLSLSPLTLLLPQFVSGKLTWKWRKDVPNVWTIHGKRYDLRPFYKQHPGGAYRLDAAKGSDCTGLFESYHVFMDREVLLKMLAMYEIKDGVPATPVPMQFDDPFFADLKQMVRDHFKSKGKWSHKMTTPHLILCFAAWASMWLLNWHMLTSNSMWCIPLLGCLSWYMTGSVMHDASHSALVAQPWLNRVFAHAAFPYGVNVGGWHIQHVMSHHIYTNEEEDVDLYHFDPVITLQKGMGTVHLLLHCFRMFYVLSTAVMHLAMVVPYGLLFHHVDPAHGHKMYDRVKAIEAHRVQLRPEMMIEVALLVLWWAMCATHQGFITALCFQLSIYAVSSYLFCFFTQVSHLQEECFMAPEERKALPFAKRQVLASMDFAADSKFWSNISGGLNTQAIHHCFPSVSAIHLRDLYPKFRQLCRKHGVELKEAKSLSSFLWGYFLFVN